MTLALLCIGCRRRPGSWIRGLGYRDGVGDLDQLGCCAVWGCLIWIEVIKGEIFNLDDCRWGGMMECCSS